MTGVSADELRPAGSTSRAGAVVREHAWALAVCAAMAAWTVVLYAIVRDAFLDFRLGRFDLGNMVQAVWSTTEGRPLEYTHGSTGEQVVRLAAHVDPFLVLLAPLWLVWPSPLALAFAQIAVTSLGALPVFWLGRRHLDSDRAAGLLALGYLAYPWTATSATGAIHPVTFAIPLLLFCVWFLDSAQLAWFGVCAALAMSTGELMGLPIACLGIWYGLARRERVAGVAIALAGFAWTLVAIYVVVPHYAGGGSMFYGFYDEVGGSPLGVARTLFTDPLTVLGALVHVNDIAYVLWLGIPLLFLFVLSPLALVAFLPEAALNQLSATPTQTSIHFHYLAAAIPPLVAATVLGAAALARRFPARTSTEPPTPIVMGTPSASRCRAWKSSFWGVSRATKNITKCVLCASSMAAAVMTSTMW